MLIESDDPMVSAVVVVHSRWVVACMELREPGMGSCSHSPEGSVHGDSLPFPLFSPTFRLPPIFGTLPFLVLLHYSLHQLQNSHRVNRPALLSLHSLPDVSSPTSRNRSPLSPRRPYNLVKSKSCAYLRDPYVANETEHGPPASAFW